MSASNDAINPYSRFNGWVVPFVTQTFIQASKMGRFHLQLQIFDVFLSYLQQFSRLNLIFDKFMLIS